MDYTVVKCSPCISLTKKKKQTKNGKQRFLFLRKFGSQKLDTTQEKKPT